MFLHSLQFSLTLLMHIIRCSVFHFRTVSSHALTAGNQRGASVSMSRVLIWALRFCHLFCILSHRSMTKQNKRTTHVDAYTVLRTAIQRPRTRSATVRQVSNAREQDLVTNKNVQFRPFWVKRTFWKVFFSIQFASSWQFQPAATGEFFVELRSIKVSHVLLFLWLVPSHLTCLL